MLLALYVVVFFLPDDVLEKLSILGNDSSQQAIGKAVFRAFVYLSINDVLSLIRAERVRERQ